MRVTEAPQNTTATIVRGLATCTLTAKSYHRIMTNVRVINPTAEGEVFVYVGSLDNTPIARNFVGSNNTLKGEFDVVPGAAVYVVWANSAGSIGTVTATFSWDRVDDSERAGTALTWDPVVSQRSLLAPDLIANNSNLALPHGSFVNLPSLLDMRGYQSWSAEVDVKTNAAATAYNPITIAYTWYQTANLGQIIYEDIYQIFADGNGSGGFASFDGRFEIQDAVHGPFLNVQVFHGGVNDATANINVYGNSRSIGRRYIKNTQDIGPTGVTLDNFNSCLLDIAGPIGAGAAISNLIRMSPGPTQVRMHSITGSLTFEYIAPDGRNIEGFNIAAAQDFHTQIILPRTAVKCRVTDTSGAPNTYQWFVANAGDNY